MDDVNRSPDSGAADEPPARSFVYPVRTLLSGIHRPAFSRSGTENSVGSTSATRLDDDIGGDAGENEVQKGSAAAVGLSEVAKDDLADQSREDGPARKKRHKHRSTNLQDLSPHEDPLKPRSFSSNPHVASIMRNREYEREVHTTVVAGPVGEPVVCNEEMDDTARDFDPPADLTETVASENADSPPCRSPESAPSNFSQLGLVHLGASSSSLSPHRSPSSGTRASQHRSRRSSPARLRPPTAGAASPAGTDAIAVPTSSARPNSVASGSNSASGSYSASGASGSSDGPRTAFRYQHVESAEGHHLIVGREGKLSTCEEEPIRTPCAVQGFGVLIALEEDNATGNLSVRQVSENATELMGLSPAYLFSLDCFTQTLSETQADLLLDNIQYLSDSGLTPQEQAEDVHVFILNGFGEAGSALPEESLRDPQRRRNWVCWCAAHRPQMTAPANPDASSSTPSSSTKQNLIVLEFELERDCFNPLYPSMPAEDALSGVSSPSEASGSNSFGAWNSNSSGRTLVSSGSGSEVYYSTPDGSTPSINEPNASSANLSSADMAVSPPPPVQVRRSTSVSPSQEQVGEWMPNAEAVLESTTSRSRPLPALERLRRMRRPAAESPGSPSSIQSGSDGRGSAQMRGVGGTGRRRRGVGAVGMMDMFAVMAQMNEQFGETNDLESFLKVVVGVLKDLTQFHRVLVYQFDEIWNGKVVAELVDWNKTHDLYRGLHFPASDIPAQARDLYALNTVRLLYDRGLPAARLVVRSKKDLETPLDMTHCYLRAMSPVHIKYLGNMGVRASMSVSIMAFGQLWGLVAMHSYGSHGMRVSFPVRKMLRLLSQSISRNVERLCYAQRLHSRKLINTMPSDQHPSGYIVTDAHDLLGLFDADYGVLVVGEGAKILGPNQHGQEILIVAEYLRAKRLDMIQVSQTVTADYPDLQLTTGLEVIAGLLYVPLSVAGTDFIAFLRKGQPTQVHWAGRPHKRDEPRNTLEPRSSFKIWSETVAGRCRAWTDEQLETAGVLALVYGKFIEVWRQREAALQTTKLTNILLSNASHEVRTPLNHIINYLEMALNGQLDIETRENLRQSHAASKSLLFTINDLLDLTRLESGNETSFNEPFDLHQAVRDATLTYQNEAQRRGLGFNLDFTSCPRTVIGDARKIRTVVANLTANSVKYTHEGSITVQCRAFDEPAGLREPSVAAIEIIVSDTGCGIASDKLESIFREFEQVEASASSSTSSTPQATGLGLGLAVVARIVEQLGGQLRVDSRVEGGSRFSFLVPLAIGSRSGSTRSSNRSRARSHTQGYQMESLAQALASPSEMAVRRAGLSPTRAGFSGGSTGTSLSAKMYASPDAGPSKKLERPKARCSASGQDAGASRQLRMLVVEDNDVNRTILAKRLTLDGHIVVNTTNGQEGLTMLEADQDFDCVLMDIQMPLLNGYEATECIRMMERQKKLHSWRLAHKLNGRIPIFAVSASLLEAQREDMYNIGMDGWILKPIDFKRLRTILKGVTDAQQRAKDVYTKGSTWELGGWLCPAQTMNGVDLEDIKQVP